MSHFAQIDDNNIVTQVIKAEQDFIDTLPDSDKWIQTSYNTHWGQHYSDETGEPDGGTQLRKNFAAIGYTYDPVRDAFIPPQPFPSWTLNEDKCDWEAPVPFPEDGISYYWDEANTTWTETL